MKKVMDMFIDEALLKNAQDAAARLRQAERDVEVVRANYYHAIRRLHLAGTSLRDIAAALDLSHQRVHQIIQSSSGGWRRHWNIWKEPEMEAAIVCSFCGSSDKEAAKLVRGPGFNICNRCITRGTQVLDGAAVASKQRTQLTAIDPGTKFRCSFCGRGATEKRRLVAGRNAQICSECLTFAAGVLPEQC